MDDFILLLEDKGQCKKILNKIREFLKNNLNLELNNKSDYYPSYLGIDFCGYKIYETHILLRKRFKKKLNKNIKLWVKLKQEDKFYEFKFKRSFNSYLGHASHSNSYYYLNKIKYILNKLNVTKDSYL